MHRGQIVSEVETGDLLLIGGHDGPTPKDSIYRFFDINGDWVLLDTHLENARYQHASMIVTDSMLSGCVHP